MWAWRRHTGGVLGPWDEKRVGKRAWWTGGAQHWCYMEALDFTATKGLLQNLTMLLLQGCFPYSGKSPSPKEPLAVTGNAQNTVEAI